MDFIMQNSISIRHTAVHIPTPEEKGDSQWSSTIYLDNLIPEVLPLPIATIPWHTYIECQTWNCTKYYVTVIIQLGWGWRRRQGETQKEEDGEGKGFLPIPTQLYHKNKLHTYFFLNVAFKTLSSIQDIDVAVASLICYDTMSVRKHAVCMASSIPCF